MTVYENSIEAGVFFFPLLALVLTLPYLLYSYRKYGAVSFFRSLVFFSFLLYILCAYFLVVLPLPDPATVADRQGPFMQLIPFHFISDFLKGTALNIHKPSTFLPALKQRVLWEPIFNALLTLPFGVYLSAYFRRSLKQTLLLTFCLSLFFELTQLTGLYGIYPKPYRLFDVDDLMINTLGGFLGYLIGSHLARRLPSQQKMRQEGYCHSLHVSFARRAVAFLVDLLVVVGIQCLLEIPLGSRPWLFPMVYFLYFVFLETVTKGLTLGKALVRIRTEGMDAGAPFALALFVKYALVYLVYLFVLFLQTLLLLSIRWVGLLSLFLAVGLLCFLFVDFVLSFRREKRLWYERWSHTRNRSTLRRQEDLEPCAEEQRG